MAGLGDGEHSMSILKRLLANAALRDEAGRLRSPEAGARLPSAVSLGVWGVGCRGPWPGPSPVPELAVLSQHCTPPPSAEGWLHCLPGEGWAQGAVLREGGAGNSWGWAG